MVRSPRASRKPVEIDREAVIRLWLHRQGLARPFEAPLTRERFVEHLERTGALQLDSVNVVDRAHYLTLWSRFGAFDRAEVDRWIYRDRVAFEHWGHEASVLPASRLPLALRGMRLFAPRGDWWASRTPSAAAFRRVLRRIRAEGPLETADFESREGEGGPWWGWKEDKQALEMLWHRGRLATSERRSFRRVYDLAERVYGEVSPAGRARFEDGWFLAGLSGNGVARERHLEGYFTAPRPNAALRRKIIARNVAKGRAVEAEVGGQPGWYVAPEHLDLLGGLPRPAGTTLICPFDSLLWQRSRAEDLLGFRYRVEIYVPPEKRAFGYYVMPILHDGILAGRLDPKMHRDEGVLEIKALSLEPGFRRRAAFDGGLAGALASLASFLGAREVRLPVRWRRLAV